MPLLAEHCSPQIAVWTHDGLIELGNGESERQREGEVRGIISISWTVGNSLLDATSMPLFYSAQLSRRNPPAFIVTYHKWESETDISVRFPSSAKGSGDL